VKLGCFHADLASWSYSRATESKAQVLLVLVVLPWWILSHTWKVFDEICVKHEEALLI
jgi:hypothetical protein